MTGFADGFATGYGLVDRTLTERENAELRRQQLDQQDRQSRDSLARQTNRDAAQDTQFAKKLGLEQSGLESRDRYQQGSLDLQRQQHENQNNQFDKKLGLDNRKLGIEENIAKAGITDKQADNERENKKLGLEEAKTNSVINANNAKEKRDQAKFEHEDELRKAQKAMDYLSTKYDSKTDNINIGDNEAEVLKVHQALIDAVGVDAVDVYHDPKGYDKAVTDVQEMFNSNDGNPLTNQDSIASANKLFGRFIRVGIGEDVPGKGKVVDKKATGILAHKVDATPDNPTGIVYTIGVQTTYDNDGKQITDVPGPMTKKRSNNPKNDPNIKTFTADQLYKATNAVSATIDFINSNQSLREKLRGIHGKSNGEKNKYLDFTEENTNVNTGEISKKQAKYNPETGEQVTMENGRIKSSKINEKPNEDSVIMARRSRAVQLLSDPGSSEESKNTARNYLKDHPI